jgi:hypothetical protein
MSVGMSTDASTSLQPGHPRCQLAGCTRCVDGSGVRRDGLGVVVRSNRRVNAEF